MLIGWETNLVDDDAGVRSILEECRRVAVLGIKTEAQAGQPAIEVPRYLAAQGYDVIPVPVYYPEVQEILGKPAYRRVQDVPGGVDLVDVFRRPQDIPPHLDDLIAARPKAVGCTGAAAHASARETCYVFPISPARSSASRTIRATSTRASSRRRSCGTCSPPAGP